MMMAGQRQEAEAVISLPMGQASTLKMERNFLFYCSSSKALVAQFLGEFGLVV